MLSFPSFSSVTINPGESVKVSVPDGVWFVSSVSLDFGDGISNQIGDRVVLFASKDGEKSGEKIALAPLTVGKYEVAQCDYEFDSSESVIFSTTGAKIPVTINGHTAPAIKLIVEKV